MVRRNTPGILSGLILGLAMGLGAQNAAGTAPEDFRLEVKLTSGRVLTGVTRNGHLHEKRVPAPSGIGLAFVPAEAGDPAAGVRLWQVGDLGGFIFIAHGEIVSVKKTGTLREGERERLDRAAREGRAASRDKILNAWRAYHARCQAAARTRLAAKRKREAEEARRQSEPPWPELSEYEMGELIFEFHPNLGWTPGWRDVIRWREIVYGIGPSPDERLWLEWYPEWLAAWDWWTRVAIPTPKPPLR